MDCCSGEESYFFGGREVTRGSASAECVVSTERVGGEGVPTYASLFARIPGDWKCDWIPFTRACRRVRWEGPQLLRIERVED